MRTLRRLFGKRAQEPPKKYYDPPVDAEYFSTFKSEEEQWELWKGFSDFTGEVVRHLDEAPLFKDEFPRWRNDSLRKRLTRARAEIDAILNKF